MAVENSWPAIDLITPTLNCQDNLERCLTSVRRQTYPGEIRITVIDGGSSDGTVNVATKLGATVHVRVGQYGFGLTGSRHEGEGLTSSPFVWLVDSDNFLVETDVAESLIRPFFSIPDLDISLPETAVDLDSSSFNRWLSLMEAENVERVKRLGRKVAPATWLLDELTYGITNCSLIRRSSLELAGGYDSDVRLLHRLRHLGRAKAAIVENAHFYHNQADSLNSYISKLRARVSRYSKMSEEDLSSYFVKDETITKRRDSLASKEWSNVVLIPLHSGLQTIQTRRWENVWGVVYPMILLVAFAPMPWAFLKVYSNWF
jgi:glycosyltransferase involved in cell wall biosynthesis